MKNHYHVSRQRAYDRMTATGANASNTKMGRACKGSNGKGLQRKQWEGPAKKAMGRACNGSNGKALQRKQWEGPAKEGTAKSQLSWWTTKLKKYHEKLPERPVQQDSGSYWVLFNTKSVKFATSLLPSPTSSALEVRRLWNVKYTHLFFDRSFDSSHPVVIQYDKVTYSVKHNMYTIINT